MEPQSSAKLSEKLQDIRAAGDHHHHATSAPPSRWMVNALIGFVCGVVSFLLKECIGLLFRIRSALILGAVERGGPSWVSAAWFSAVGFAAVLLIVSASFIIYFEPHAAGSGIVSIILKSRRQSIIHQSSHNNHHPSILTPQPLPTFKPQTTSPRRARS